MFDASPFYQIATGAGKGLKKKMDDEMRKELAALDDEFCGVTREIEKQVNDIAAFYAQCRYNLTNSIGEEYLREMGFSEDTLKRFEIGFTNNDDPSGKGHPRKSIVVPITGRNYVSISIDKETPEAFAEINNKGAVRGIWNAAILRNPDAKCIFLCDKVFDALAICDAGGHAIGLNGTDNARALLETIRKAGRKDFVIVFTPSDTESGQKARQRIKKGLKAQEVEYITADINNGTERPAEAFLNRADFADAIREAEARADRARMDRPANTEDYLRTMFASDMKNYQTEIKTGFSNMDSVLRGLFPGLYILSAVPSLGKTDFALCLADQLARQGNEVMFFSLEMSRFELVSRSLSRYAYSIDRRGGDQAQRRPYTVPDAPLTALDIRCGKNPELIRQAMQKYISECGNRVSIIECNAGKVSEIRQKIETFMRKTGKRPIVFVDYIQILEPEKDHGGARENIDETISRIRRMVRELNIPCIAISALNRDSYTKGAGYEGLKESGNLEYSADVVLGLELAALKRLQKECNNKDELREKLDEEKRKNPRKIKIAMSKNRFGEPTGSMYFDYNSAVDVFTETAGERPAGDRRPINH